jgi:hypothetical protein
MVEYASLPGFPLEPRDTVVLLECVQQPLLLGEQRRRESVDLTGHATSSAPCPPDAGGETH